jgi:hypothetical protein
MWAIVRIEKYDGSQRCSRNEFWKRPPSAARFV